MTKEYEHVLIVDDHPLFAAAVSDILNGMACALSVTTVSTMSAAKRYVDANGRPPLVLLDLNLTDSPSSATLKTFPSLFQDSDVVIFSGMDDDVRVRQALSAGAIGFISKSQRPADIVGMLTKLLDGEKMELSSASVATSDESVATALSPRQKEVMDAIAGGLSNKEIAKQLAMSPGTVKVHVREIFMRLGAHNRTEAVALYNGEFTDS